MPDRWVNPQGWGPSPGRPEGWQPPPNQPAGWGTPPPGPPSTGGPRWRRWYVVLAAALVGLGVVALSDDDSGNAASQSTAPPTTSFSLPTVAATVSTTSTSPPTTVPPTSIQTVRVPNLVGMNLARAKDALAERGLKVSVKYRSTDRYPAGTVVSQSRRTGAGVLPESRITLVIAKSPPPPPTTAPPPPTTTPERNCDPSYPDACLDPNAGDYDCAGGSGNGPRYVEGPIRVRPPDPFDLDREGDGWGCEAG
jgi:PASTA domain